METQIQPEPSGIQLQVSDGSKPNKSKSNRIAQVKNLLFSSVLVGVSDGRFFFGKFYCIDKQGNIILQDSVEYCSTRRTSTSPMEQRNLGLILIPFSCRTSCQVNCCNPIEEQLSAISIQERK